MTGVEIILLLIGCIFMIGSFFVTEKLSPSELNKIAELSEEELKNIIERDLKNADAKIEDAIDRQLEASAGKVERTMEQMSNEKIMAINDYSDTVIEHMNKTHNEIMFLYNMLNDKHTELTSMTSDLQRLAADVRSMQEQAASTQRRLEELPQPGMIRSTSGVQELLNQQLVGTDNTSAENAGLPDLSELEMDMVAEEETAEPEASSGEKENHNKEILTLHEEGVKDVEIARRLGLGLGEVKLVIGLYKGELNL